MSDCRLHTGSLWGTCVAAGFTHQRPLKLPTAFLPTINHPLSLICCLMLHHVAGILLTVCKLENYPRNHLSVYWKIEFELWVLLENEWHILSCENRLSKMVAPLSTAKPQNQCSQIRECQQRRALCDMVACVNTGGIYHQPTATSISPILTRRNSRGG